MSIQKLEIFFGDKTVSVSLQFKKADKLHKREDNTGGIYNSHQANIMEFYNDSKLNSIVLKGLSHGSWIYIYTIFSIYERRQYGKGTMIRILKHAKNTSHSQAHMSDKCRQRCGDKHMANILGVDCINCCTRTQKQSSLMLIL